MWMSSITDGGNMKLLPRRLVSRDTGFFFSFAAGRAAGFAAGFTSFTAAFDFARAGAGFLVFPVFDFFIFNSFRGRAAIRETSQIEPLSLALSFFREEGGGDGRPHIVTG